MRRLMCAVAVIVLASLGAPVAASAGPVTAAEAAWTGTWQQNTCDYSFDGLLTTVRCDVTATSSRCEAVTSAGATTCSATLTASVTYNFRGEWACIPEFCPGVDLVSWTTCGVAGAAGELTVTDGAGTVHGPVPLRMTGHGTAFAFNGLAADRREVLETSGVLALECFGAKRVWSGILNRVPL